jgi:hypothetical protein
MCIQTDKQSDKISITSFTVTYCNKQTEIAYRIEEFPSYVNTAAVTSYPNSHCRLSAAIHCIPYCDEPSLVLWHLILYADETPTATHYPHVAHDC